MARARNIKPGFFKNEDLGTADPYVSLLFAGLWTLADKAGILEDRPLRIKAELFPYREGFDINGYLTVLVTLHLIHRYEVDGVKYIQVINFVKHQNPHHTEKDSEFPSYSDSCKQSVKQPLNNGDTPADSLIPDSLLLIPDSLIPDGQLADESAPSETEVQSACRETWQSYSTAYFNRYGTEPVRNAKVNGQVKNFVKRIGFSESPHVAAFYVQSNNSYYVGRGHVIDSLLNDCEKLRTEWATNTSMTATRAKQIDKHDANRSAVGEAMKILEARNAIAN